MVNASKGQKARQNSANLLTQKRLECRSNGSGSPVTPRQQFLMDRLAATEQTAKKHKKHATNLASENMVLKENNQSLVESVDNLSRKLHNKSCQANHAKITSEELRQELRCSKHAHTIQAGRLRHRKETSIEKALKEARVGIDKRWMKGKRGIFTEKSREMVRDLVSMSVAPANVDRVVHAAGAGLGINVQNHISAQHVGRIVEEGGIASDLQVTGEMHASKAYTISGDGTTVRHINYEAKNVTMYLAGSNVPTTRVLDIMSAPNHTSEEQMTGWKGMMYQTLTGTYNVLPLGQGAPINPDEFITFLKGVGSDHAPDQQKFVQEYLPEIARANHEKIQAAGGMDAWMALPEEEKRRQDVQVHGDLCMSFGQKEWVNLSAEQRMEAEALVWCGCCMHKEMNSVKGGVRAMTLFWESIGGPGPIKLMNKANSAAAANSAKGSAAETHAAEVSEGGAVKLTSLVGAVFNHKDDKKGQQETFKSYFEEFLGYRVSCPDTSNTRFQSHCNCAIFIILYLPQILKFMSHILYSKQKVSLNHMEANILAGLKDIPTLTKLAVLALYSLAVSYVYMRVVRATGKHLQNALDLGPLHVKVIAFCESIAENTDLLLAPDASYVTGTLDGKQWEHPDVFYAVHALLPSLPLRAFMIGAANKWKDFSSEFSPEGPITRLSPAARAKIYINPTNDVNEGALGCLRRAICEAIRLSLRHHNAKSKYAINNTRAFLRSKAVTEAVRIWLRTEARKQIDSGQEKKRRKELVMLEKIAVEEKQQKEAERKLLARQRQVELDNLVPLLDTTWIQANHKQIKNNKILKQINWHRQFTEKGVIPMKTLVTQMRKDDKVIQLIVAINQYNQDILPRLEAISQAAIESGIDSSVEMPIEQSWEEEEELEDADMLDDY
ncbi:hypothetical protein CPB85DRAFT_1482410 [Mucidula mucida]|nr:hypothetical protein CPB85DRAFT_1482410 [Mucidula mucida]